MIYINNNQNLKKRRQNLRNNMPVPEQILWYYLRGKNVKGYKFRRQYSIGQYILDFYCPKLRLAIEVEGDSHFIDSKTKYDDQNREKFLLTRNIVIIRFTNTDVRENIEGVFEEISKHLPLKSTTPSQLPAAGEGGNFSYSRRGISAISLTAKRGL